MTSTKASLVAAVACLLATNLQLPRPEQWAAADRATPRLDPMTFTELPQPIRSELSRRGCSIPQPFTGGRQNVVSGSFFREGQIDWAILCSVERSSSILVFQDGKTDRVGALAPRADRDYLQTIGGGKIGFSRSIFVASPGYIAEHHPDATVRPALTHSGIGDAFLEKASVVWY